MTLYGIYSATKRIQPSERVVPLGIIGGQLRASEDPKHHGNMVPKNIKWALSGSPIMPTGATPSYANYKIPVQICS